MTIRRILIAGNWKMNLLRDEAVGLAHAIASRPTASVDVAVFPPFPWIPEVRRTVNGTAIAVGAQNCHTDAAGAFTGEVSAPMLTGLCDYVLAGHSERRHVFGETDEIVARKVAAIVAANLKPVLCVGETLEQRQAHEATDVVARQLTTGLAAIGKGDIMNVTIAYEPVWAIGTGVAATAADAQDMCQMVREWLADTVGDTAQQVRILYGGSMTAENAAALLSQADVDGGLVGGASLNAASFLAIVAAAEQSATV